MYARCSSLRELVAEATADDEERRERRADPPSA
jgi:hypothetical protein